MQMETREFLEVPYIQPLMMMTDYKLVFNLFVVVIIIKHSLAAFNVSWECSSYDDALLIDTKTLGILNANNPHHYLSVIICIYTLSLAAFIWNAWTFEEKKTFTQMENENDSNQMYMFLMLMYVTTHTFVLFRWWFLWWK